MIENRERQRPRSFQAFYGSVRHRWLLPILLLDWVAEWAAYGLSRTSFLEFLEYCGSFSILIGVIFYFMDAPERTKLKHYQAWQVINTAQGKGGSGGRADALHELNEDHVPLVGVDLSDAFLQDLQLQQADARRSLFRAADLKDSNLSGCNFEQADFTNANLRNCNFSLANFTNTALKNVDLTNANLSNANVQGTQLDEADLTNADLSGVINWKAIPSLNHTNIRGVKNAPPGFIAWALSKGAVDAPPGP